jgi:hypothetical protein
MTARSIASSIARALGQPASGSGGGGTSYTAETLAYAARVNSGGGTMTTAGLQLVDAIFANAASQGITLERGYYFGHGCNVNANTEREVLEVTGDGTPFVADSVSNDSDIYSGLGSLCLEGYTDQQGYLASTDPLWTNNDWSMLVFHQKPLIDTADSNSYSMIMSQYAGSGTGNAYLLAGQTGSMTLQPIGGGTSVSWRNSGFGGAGAIEPVAVFLTYNSATRAWVVYNPVTQATIGTGAMPANFSALATRLGATQFVTSSRGPRIIAYGGILKYTGILDSTEMNSVWSTFLEHHSKLCHKAWITGNSITAGSNAAEGGSNSALNWPTLYSQQAARNNIFTLKPNGLFGVDAFIEIRPSDYVKPAGSLQDAYSAYVASKSVDTWKVWRPSIWINDENAGMAARNSDVADYEIDYGTLVDAIAEDLRELDPNLKIIQGTQTAIMAGDLTAPYDPIPYAEVEVSDWRINLRDWSVLIRTDDRYDAVAELFGNFSLGWDVGDDGNAINTLTDLPNGDPDLHRWGAGLASGDSQHWNTAGHALGYSLYWTATESIL